MSEFSPDPRRLKAWVTRRSKYGAAGHAGPYRTGKGSDDLGRLALAFVLRLYANGDLSEGQCCRALQIDRVTFRELAEKGGS